MQYWKATQDNSGGVFDQSMGYRLSWAAETSNLSNTVTSNLSEQSPDYSASQYPYDCVCYITATFSTGLIEQGSGVIIGPHTVLTASHVLWNQTLDEGASSFTVSPGFSETGTQIAGQMVSHYYEVDDANDVLTPQASQQDFAVIDTAENLTSYGSFGVETNYSGGTVHITGYPAIDGGEQTDQVGAVTKDPTYSLLDYSTVSVSPGNSGGPVWIDLGTDANPQPTVVGVVSTTASAVQLTPADYQTILTWESEDSYLWAGNTPTVTAIGESPATGVLSLGDSATLTVDFSEAVTVTGALTLTLNDGGTARFTGGSGTDALSFSYTVSPSDSDTASLAISTINLNGGSIADASGDQANLSISGILQSGPQVETVSGLLSAAFSDILRCSPESPLATTPTITLADGESVPNPIYQDAQTLAVLESEVASFTLEPAQALATIEQFGVTTTSVASIAYQFFTGATPTSAGYDYLINSPSNPNDLDSAYYAEFNEENRYINFAVNLGKFGAGEANFSETYGPLSLADAMTLAYTEIFGFTPAAGKIADLLDAVVGTNETRADYFAYYGQDGLDGLGTKAAAVGWLMVEAAKADLGVYAAAEDNFLSALAAGNGQYNIDLLTAYPTMTAVQAAAMEVQGVASIVSAVQVSDIGASITTNLDALQALAAGGELSSIVVTDASTRALLVSATQLATDSQALGNIISNYDITATGDAAQFNGVSVPQMSNHNSLLEIYDLNSAALSATFSENSMGTSGQLNLSDGVHSITVNLVGQFAYDGYSGPASTAGFSLVSDGASGTDITYHG